MVFQGKWVDEIVEELVSGAVSARLQQRPGELPQQGYVEGRILIRLMLYPLELKTYRLMVQNFPFREDDIPPYVHRLISEYREDAVPLIEELLLRADLDFGPYEVYRVLRQLAGLPSTTSINLPAPHNSDYFWLDALQPLDEQLVATVATKLLDTFEFTKAKVCRSFSFSDQEYDVTYSPFTANSAGLLALSYRVRQSDRVPLRYFSNLVREPFFNLDLFFRFLQPVQTEDLLRAILDLPDGNGRFLAYTRDIPEAKGHFEAMRDHRNSS